MPAAVALKGAIIVATVITAAAIAVYESPQARQFAEDVRRKLAIALHSLGDEINPRQRQPRFNRPEDAEGFMTSRAEPGVEADEDTKRRQREELMYWNSVHLEKLAKEKKLQSSSDGIDAGNGARTERPPMNTRGSSSFEDFLQQDEGAAKGTFVYNTGADVNLNSSREPEEGLRNRGLRGLNRGSVYANPFADENHIEWEEQRVVDAGLLEPEAEERMEVMSEGIYSANEEPREIRLIAEQLVDTTTTATTTSTTTSYPDPPLSIPEIEEDTNYTNMSHSSNAAFASIHAWADNANASFYSPLPVTPSSPTFSAPALSDDHEHDHAHASGVATPTSATSGEEIWAPRSGATSEADIDVDRGDEVMSVVSDEGGVSTPGSWTEVGSVVSENEDAVETQVHN